MKKGILLDVRTPRGTVKRGRFVEEVDGAFGLWLVVAPVDEAGKTVKGVDTFRCRPSMVTPV